MTPSSAAPRRAHPSASPPPAAPLRAVPASGAPAGLAAGVPAELVPPAEAVPPSVGRLEEGRGSGADEAAPGAVRAEVEGAPDGSAWGGLPDPAPLATNLARCVFEILAGARDIEQVARWVSDDVYRHLLKRVVLAARARSARGESAQRPSFSVGSVRVTEPSAGVAEAVVIIHGRARSRAVALRLESFGSRWRATAVHVL